MKSVIFSINKPHTDNIKSGAKTSELRTRPPKIDEPYKAYIYETLKDGGCGKVIGEFTAYNENTYRICMGVPINLVTSGCISAEEILRYTKNGEKDLTEISISDLVIYDKPKELSEFRKSGALSYDDWLYGMYNGTSESSYEKYLLLFALTRPPQSWCYVEECGK
ncbi:MAG: hypothetical protein E7507_01350 [Ruminococcus sp.]|nr:hypothetical protein [Ruminococcus sp.]